MLIRYALETIPPLYTAGVRHLCAGSILLAWASAKGLRPTWAQIRASVVIGFLFFLVGHGSLHWAERIVPSGLASLLFAIEPIFVFLLSSAAGRRWKLNGMLQARIVVGLAGVGILMRNTAGAPEHGLTLGSIMILVGAFAWSVGIIYSRRSHLSGNPLLLSALSLLAGAVMLLATATLVGEVHGFSFSQVSRKSALALVYLILFGSVIAFTAYNWLLEHYSFTLVSTHTYVNPVVAVFLGWVFGGAHDPRGHRGGAGDAGSIAGRPRHESASPTGIILPQISQILDFCLLHGDGCGELPFTNRHVRAETGPLPN